MDLIYIYQNYILFIMYGLVLAVLIALFFLDSKIIIRQFNGIKRKTWIYLLIIFLSGLVLRLFVFPQVHLMYIDEPLYLEQAKNIIEKHQLVNCKYTYDGVDDYCGIWILKPPAWPFLISIAFLLFGVNNYVALYVSSIIGSLSIILIFLLTYLIFNNNRMGLWSAFFLALTPIHVLWSNSAETNNISVFFVLLTMIFFMIYVKCGEKVIFFLTTIVLIFTIFVRFENIILMPILVLGYIKFFNRKNSLLRFLNSFYLLIVIVIVIVLIILMFFIGKFFGRFNYGSIIDYGILNFLDFLKVTSFNYLYLPLAVLSLYFYNKKDKNGLIFLMISLIFFFFPYLLIFSESRMALIPSIFIIMLSSYSLEKIFDSINNYLSIIRIFVFLIFLFLFGLNLKMTYEDIYTKYNQQLLETSSVMQIKNEIPENCYIIAEFPIVLTSISSIKGLSTKEVIKNPGIIDYLVKKNACIYYFYDGYCNGLPISYSLRAIKRCRKMLEIFNHSKVKRFERGNTQYFLYKIDNVSS